MYTPTAFQQQNIDTLVKFVEEHAFGTLITSGTPPAAAHIPMLIERGTGNQLTILGHVAAQNPLAACLDQVPVLAIFQGPHSYISPTWYGVQNSVPTWNYLTVHATGPARLIEDPQRLRSLIERTTEHFESQRENRWSLASVDEAFVERLLTAIVGFEIQVDMIEGQWKLSQNHSRERRERVVAGLRTTNDQDALRIADLMEDRLHEEA